MPQAEKRERRAKMISHSDEYFCEWWPHGKDVEVLRT